MDEMVSGWNELTQVCGRIAAGYAGIGVFLLASAASGHEMPASEVISEAIKQGDA